jgi:hypothetical protein
MRKVFEVLKKYFVIAFVLSTIIFIWSIVSMVRSNTLPTVDFLYIIKIVFCILAGTVILVPVIALADWLIVKSAKALFNDYKESDRKGRIIIIVVVIILLLRKILIWTR